MISTDPDISNVDRNTLSFHGIIYLLCEDEAAVRCLCIQPGIFFRNI